MKNEKFRYYRNGYYAVMFIIFSSGIDVPKFHSDATIGQRKKGEFYNGLAASGRIQPMGWIAIKRLQSFAVDSIKENYSFR